MKNIIITASMLLFVFAAQVFALAPEAADNATNDSINASLTNETIQNATLTNATTGNETLENETLAQNDSDPFANAKNRQPGRR